MKNDCALQNRKTILLVEDDIDIQEINKDMLERRGGYKVEIAMNLAAARRSIAEAAPDLVVLDITLPDGSGLDLLKELQENTNLTTPLGSFASIPVLLLTARGEPEDIARGLRLGGDDYLSKPYHNDVLLARIETILRRAPKKERLLFGPLVLDIETGQALLNAENLWLSTTEFSLLRHLAKNKGNTISAEDLYQAIWRQKMGPDSQAVRIAVSRLRSKLTGSGYTITAIRNHGYRFEQE